MGAFYLETALKDTPPLDLHYWLLTVKSLSEIHTMNSIGCLTKAVVAVALTLLMSQATLAQTHVRKGILLINQIRTLAARDSTLSMGSLLDLKTDSNFAGEIQQIVNDAATILDGYTVVKRGGFFPENAGIPRDRQLTPVEAVYHIYALPNGNELLLYRSPMVNTAQYFIRRTKQ